MKRSYTSLKVVILEAPTSSNSSVSRLFSLLYSLHILCDHSISFASSTTLRVCQDTEAWECGCSVKSERQGPGLLYIEVSQPCLFLSSFAAYSLIWSSIFCIFFYSSKTSHAWWETLQALRRCL